VAAETLAGKTAEAPVTLVSPPLHHTSLHPLPVLMLPFSLPRSAGSGHRRRWPEGNEANGRRCSLRHGGSGQALDARLGAPRRAATRRELAFTQTPPTIAAGTFLATPFSPRTPRACVDEEDDDPGSPDRGHGAAWPLGHVGPCTGPRHGPPLPFFFFVFPQLHLETYLGQPKTPPAYGPVNSRPINSFES
jgi:hypothetical protein